MEMIREGKEEENFSITISLVLIFIARNIKTNDFHFIWLVRRRKQHEAILRGVGVGLRKRKKSRITFSRLENVIFITLIKFKLPSRERLSPAAYYFCFNPPPALFAA